MDVLWYVFELVGTIAFAISGALVGVARKMDIFGMVVLASVTAIGGGIIRDMMVGAIPPNSLRTGLYIAMIVVVTVIVFFIYRTKYRKRMNNIWGRRIYLTADALGLASFTVTGTSVGISYYSDMPVLAVILGVITAVGGGIIRDILAQRIPSVLKEEVYALPAIIGGILYYMMTMDDFGVSRAYLAFIVVFCIRIYAIYKHWDLPKIQSR